MAHVDIRLPEVIEQGARGGPMFSTTISTTVAGYEQRNGNWTLPLRKWDIGVQAFTKDDLDALVTHFHLVGGRYASFRFRDWSDYSVTQEQGVLEFAGPNQYRLTKLYSANGGSVTFSRYITRPWEVTIYGSDGEPINSVGVDYNTGLVTIYDEDASAIGWAGTFDLAVRFDSDQLDIQMDQVDVAVVSMTVTEVRE